MTSRATPPPGARHNLVEHVDTEAETSSLMATTNQLTFSGRAEKRSEPRPTSKTRKNNPQPKSFRSAQLPSGQTINVSRHTDTDGHGGVPLTSRSLDLDDGFKSDSTFRHSFRSPQVEGWQRGNISRYGQNLQPWANSFRASRGIVPTINALDLDVTTKTTPTNSEAYATGLQFSNRFSSTSSRRAPTTISDEDVDNMSRIMPQEAADAVESWMRAAPGFEGEVIKRMLRDVALSLSETADHSPKANKDREATGNTRGGGPNINNTNTSTSTSAGADDAATAASKMVTKTDQQAYARSPDHDVVSKWGGPVTNVV